MRLFLDTGVILAAVLPRDPDHQAAVRIMRSLADGEWTAAYTSDFVLAEAFNFLRMKVKRADTAEALRGLVFGIEGVPPPVRGVLRVHAARFAAALDHYRDDFGRGLSLTDWTSVVLARDEELDAIATFNAGFFGLVRVVDG